VHRTRLQNTSIRSVLTVFSVANKLDQPGPSRTRMPKSTTLRLLCLLLALAWMGTIFLLSSLPGGKIEMGPPGFDKILHMGAYALLAMLILGALLLPPGGYRLGQALLAAVIAAVYGLTDEWHQFYVPGRSMDGWDMLADAVGALLGALVLRRISRR
jgi:hypothetical protein